MSEIAARVARVRERIAAASRRAGREPAAVRILAISKRHPVAVIPAAYAAGIGDVGESFAQEMVAKLADLGAGPDCPGGSASPDLRWHFVGKLQRNKVKLVVGRAHLIHAVDNPALAAAISKRAASAGIVQNLLVAVNMAAETTKSGVAAGAAKELVAAIDALPAVACMGLMTMPPLVQDGEDNRRYFAGLRGLRESLRSAARPLATLSMGTSSDFEVAVEEGATLVRVGTGIFGPRPV